MIEPYEHDLMAEQETLDIHYNSIIKYKYGMEPNSKNKKTDEEGEEGYAIEMFLFGDFKITDILIKSSDDLGELCNTKLYSGNNLEDLHKIISEIIGKVILNLINDEISKNDEEFHKNVLNKNNNINNNCQKKNNIYYFKNCGKEGKY